MKSLWDAAAVHGGTIAGELVGPGGAIKLSALSTGSTLPGELEALRGLSVLVATAEQLPTALALLELDGVVRRMVLCTPDLTDQQLAAVASTAQADAILVSKSSHALASKCARPIVLQPLAVAAPAERRVSERTEWVLLTSGTTGAPKLVVHTLHSLAGSLPRQSAAGDHVWSTFYDIRRYGGLQIYLRALLSGSSLVLTTTAEPTRDFLGRAAAARVTHISGTSSHWRRALMSGAADRINPQYVRLSGEIADQDILDSLRSAYPKSRIAHAFASTEAGLAFEVNDGLAGFPETFISQQASASPARVNLNVVDRTLRIRSQGAAARYLGEESTRLADEDGFIDTGDIVELVNDRYFFRGRRGGVINVGGMKVYPEEVEAVLNADARVHMSLVHGRRNPITGSIVVADVVLSDHSGTLGEAESAEAERVKGELMNACRQALPAHKVPARLRLVSALEVTAAGKLVRPDG
jgi:acyl-coenzyme A synthetase/AMP-(fatty) acid ligase